jgi:hypothetical protein
MRGLSSAPAVSARPSAGTARPRAAWFPPPPRVACRKCQMGAAELMAYSTNGGTMIITMTMYRCRECGHWFDLAAEL